VDALPVLLRCSLFESVPAGELEAVAGQATVRSFDRGTYLFHQGDPAGPLFIVLTGAVKIVGTGPSGNESVLALLGSDSVLGDLSLFEPEPERTADAQAIETTQCLVLPRGQVRSLLEAYPVALRRLVSRLGESIQRKDRELADMAFLDVPGRVAKKLLELAAAHGRPGVDGTRIEVRLSQRTLAGMVGASRENVNRALAAFSAQGAIRQEGGIIIVLSASALRRRC
jgi:CRP/FNR family transcriptional regulator, cyclic AMP receptor protein